MKTGLIAADLRHRSGVFVGTFVSVGFGAALFSLCAGLFTSAIILSDETGVDYGGEIAVFATMGAISVFASLFVVASTVALSVEQRRADMALLRSVGATPRQVRRLVLREVAVVAIVAALIGAALGVPLAAGLAGVFAGFDDFPAQFEYRSNPLPLIVSICVIWVAAFLSALSAARGAGRASPAEAMTGASAGRQRLGVVRWLFGLVTLGGFVALTIVSATTNDEPGLGVGYVFMASAVGLVGVALLGQVVVRPAARLVGVVFRATSTGSLAVANAIAESHRTAATAGPVALMLAVNVGMVQASLAADDLGTDGTQLWSLYVIIAISVGFAGIAVVNTTAMTITRRRDQLASLRLAGATPRQVRRSAEVESALATLAGSAIGVAIAMVVCWAFALAVDVSFLGLVQWGLIASLVALALVLAVITATTTAGRLLADPMLLAQGE